MQGSWQPVHTSAAPKQLLTDLILNRICAPQVSPPGPPEGGPGVLASFLWNDDAFELMSKVGTGC